MEITTLTCISCPIGCQLEIEHEGKQISKISGNSCPRGAKYAEQEFIDPRRTFSTTVPLSGGRERRLPVKLTAPIPKARLLEAAEAIHRLHAEAPIQLGDVIARNLLGLEGVDVVSVRTVARYHQPKEN